MSNFYKILRCEKKIRHSPTLSHLRGHTACDRLPIECKTRPVASSPAIWKMSRVKIHQIAHRDLSCSDLALVSSRIALVTYVRDMCAHSRPQHVVLGEPRSAATRDSRECTCACACASSATARAYTIPARAGRASQKMRSKACVRGMDIITAIVTYIVIRAAFVRSLPHYQHTDRFARSFFAHAHKTAIRRIKHDQREREAPA